MSTISEDAFSRAATRALRAAGSNPRAAVPALKALAKKFRGNRAAVAFCDAYVNDKGDCAGLVPWSKLHYGGMLAGEPQKVERIEGAEPGQAAYTVILPHERHRYAEGGAR